MIEISISTDGKKVADSLKVDNPTLGECSLMVFRLEEIKQEILARDFKSEFEVREGDFVDSGEEE